MAEMEFSSKKNSNSAAKKTVKIDLTPMVDLGFLLLSFFVFTSTLAKPRAMDIVTPYDKVQAGDDICNSCALTVLLAPDDKLLYYEGAFNPQAVFSSDFHHIRELIQAKKLAVKKIRGKEDEFTLIIKSADSSSFRNFVDITDEVAINAVKRYYIDEISAAEKALMH